MYECAFSESEGYIKSMLIYIYHRENNQKNNVMLWLLKAKG